MFKVNCPRCGKPFRIPVHRADGGSKWYQLAATRSYCPWCNTELTLSRASRRLSGTHLWPFLLAMLFGIFIPDRSLRDDVLWAGIALMLAARVVFLFKRCYVAVDKRA